MLKISPIKFFYNSKFDFTTKSLVTNTVVITKVFCTLKSSDFEVTLCFVGFESLLSDKYSLLMSNVNPTGNYT